MTRATHLRVSLAAAGIAAVAIGIALAIGLAGSYAAVQLLRNMLFRVSVHDPWIFAAGAVVLAAVALVACGVPALRATRVDPVTALRHE